MTRLSAADNCGSWHGVHQSALLDKKKIGTTLVESL
jgi:hypothetical protein